VALRCTAIRAFTWFRKGNIAATEAGFADISFRYSDSSAYLRFARVSVGGNPPRAQLRGRLFSDNVIVSASTVAFQTSPVCWPTGRFDSTGPTKIRTGVAHLQ